MMPGVPSEVTSSGSFRPRRFMSSKNAVIVSASSLEPVIMCSSTRRPSIVKPQAARTGSRFGARPQTLGDAIDKQICDLVLAFRCDVRHRVSADVGLLKLVAPLPPAYRPVALADSQRAVTAGFEPWSQEIGRASCRERGGSWAVAGC